MCIHTGGESNNALAHAQDMQAPAPRERPTARNAATLPLWVSRLAAFTAVWGGWASQCNVRRDSTKGITYEGVVASAGRVQGMTVDRAHEIVLPSGGFFQKRTLGAAAWRDQWPDTANHARRAKQLADGLPQLPRESLSPAGTPSGVTIGWAASRQSGERGGAGTHALVTSPPAGTESWPQQVEPDGPRTGALLASLRPVLYQFDVCAGVDGWEPGAVECSSGEGPTHEPRSDLSIDELLHLLARCVRPTVRGMYHAGKRSRMFQRPATAFLCLPPETTCRVFTLTRAFHRSTCTARAQVTSPIPFSSGMDVWVRTITASSIPT
jgi:hypothetical protein